VTNKTPTIVVIDDSPTSISLYELSAGPLNVELKTFQSPVESLGYLSDNGADLVFLDILMRQMDGLTTLKKLREIEGHENTPVVMVTSKDYAQDRSTAKQLGALEFLVKPLRSQEIREIICKYTPAQPKPG
jgi:CheY-like chemotaxis protein